MAGISSTMSTKSSDSGHSVSRGETIIHSKEDEGSRQNYEILCLFQKCNKLAAASYNIYSHVVKVLESCDNYRPDYFIVRNLLSHIAPRVILINVNASRDLIEKIQELVIDQQSSIKQLPSAIFNYSNCKETLFSTHFLNNLFKRNYIHSVINSADERLVSVLGALLSQLKEILPALLPTHVLELNISSISMMSFENIVWIDNETYKCLQVFDPLLHPSGFKWSNQSYYDDSKGLSVYSIIEKNTCVLGSSKLRSFLYSPTKDFNELKKRHEVIKFCNEPRFNKIFQTMKTQMSHLSPVDVLIGNVECANVRGKHWKSIYQNIYYSVLLAETCKENLNDVQVFQEIASSLTDEMYAMAYHLDRIIDFQRMEGNEIFVVKCGVSESLEKAKINFSKLTHAINKVVPYEFDTIPSYINKVHMLYIPEMKFLLSIPYWKNNLKKEELELPGLEYKFTSNRTAYYKTKRCYELDNLLGDPQIDIMMEEANIIRALGKYIRQNISSTFLIIEKIAYLDCLFALAALAKEYDYIPPKLKEDKIINIRHGTHPLLKICTDKFIPNSFVSSSDDSLVKIIYGPNSSGKTVYLKQIALLTYLTHIGSYIPARNATMGMCSHIHTRLSSAESIISESSSYMNDLRKLVAIVNSARPTSLLILDEIGKGTTELSGVAVIASCLNHLLSLGVQCPHTVVSTHFTSVSDYIQPVAGLFSIQVMNYIVEDDKYVFLYSVKGREHISHFDSDLNPFPETPEFIAAAAKKVLLALRSGQNVNPYTILRLQKCRRYYSFLQRFAATNPQKEGLIGILRRKVKSLMS